MQHSFWHSVPIVRLLIAFLLGISTAMFYAVHIAAALATAIVFLLLGIVLPKWFSAYQQRWFSGICFFGLFYCLGIVLNIQQNHLNNSNHFSYQPQVNYFLVTVNEEPVKKAHSYKMRTKVQQAVLLNNTTISVSGNIVVYVSNKIKQPLPVYGDVLVINANQLQEVSAPKNPQEFNYKRYLAFNHIHHQAYLTQIVSTQINMGNVVVKYIISIQHYFKQVLQNYVQHPAAIGVAQALLYGFDDDIDQETMAAYANTGTLHVLAVSGMHVGIIFLILNFLLAFMRGNKKAVFAKQVIILVALWVYSALCGLSPSILRATVMFSFIIVAGLLNRRSNIYNTLAASCFVLLCVDTNTLANVGFQLSYLAVLGIVFIQPLIYKWYVAPNWTVKQIWKITTVSLAAQLATSPVGILYFHQFPNCFLFSNLLIIPLTTIILYACIALLVFSKITIVATLLGKAIMYVILFTNWLVKLVEQTPYAYINGLQISITQSVLLYVVLLGTVLYFLHQQKWLFMLSLFCLSLFWLIDTRQEITNSTQQKIMVYAIKNNTAIQVVNGTNSTLLLSNNIKNDKQKFKFHLQQHIWHIGSQHIDTVETKAVWQIIELPQKRMLITGKNNTKLPAMADVLVVRNNIDELMLAKISTKQMVLTGELQPHHAKRIKQWCLAKNIACHDVLFSGAFELLL